MSIMYDRSTDYVATLHFPLDHFTNINDTRAIHITHDYIISKSVA